ncbi:SDR family NAD(P)-dependent oxidoreductase [Niveispirillum cyanobacteriorum]|uniref:3-oxoacyl-ACP reductase n=1 Tax=Niveispirillum cyanobacteriorum TaxID=1612173 RepID=A0A2K9NDG9_9PROT|nr:SDR family oxidoreductase [Niveispirillum cyanobacteriorum]AUN31168.1 3-oxoacyl-ACP reductase [Niveispirillum cyanobacteriorum]GGE88586.1 L-xylulose reductase [Niveispirillum cyanobacteriorum]
MSVLPDPFAAFSLEGRVALVTGAGKGIGRAAALALAQAGAQVIAVARTGTDLAELAAEAPAGRVEGWEMDATAPAFLDRIRALPGLDILVNNLGINRPLPFTEVPVETLDAMLSVNVRTTFLVSQVAVDAMRRGGRGGAVIQVSSQMGHVGSPRRTVYCMTKHALEGLTKAMAVELAPEGIRVNSVCPTFIETPLTAPMLADHSFREFVQSRIPLGRVGRVGEVAPAILFLASPAASLITGAALMVDGGWTAQ